MTPRASQAMQNGRREQGFTVWLTGLSGAGKTTIAQLVGTELERRGRLVECLDGDVVRNHLSPGLGFSRAERDENVARIAWMAARLTRHGAAVVAAVISPYEAARQRARAVVEEFGPFIEVLVDAPIAACARRDVKGLYRRALAGEVRGFTGISDPYERPERPDLVVPTLDQEPGESARCVLDVLEERRLVVPARVEA